MTRAAIFALKRADRATRKTMDERLANSGLTSAQLDILLYLNLRGSLAQRDLQAALGVTSATLTRILDGMVARDFVERREDPADARAKLITMTDRACLILDQLHDQEEAAFLAQFTAGFSADEIATLTHWLHRIATNMGDTSHAIFSYGAAMTEEEESNECRYQTV